MSEFWAAVAGAIIGAIISGVIAYALQKQNLNEARQQRREEDKRHKEEAEERRRALAHALMFKMIRIYSHLRQLSSQLIESLERGKKNLGADVRPWMVIEPIMNAPDHIHFETDEIVMLLGLKDYALFNDLAELDERHNGTLKAISVYNERRLELTPLMPADSFRGNVGSGWSDDQRFLPLMPRMIEVDSIIRAIIPQCAAQASDAWSVLERLQKLLASKVGTQVRIEPLSDAEIAEKGERGSNL